ncbi:hypothetical protein V6N12_043783 [Hibiscus sabdariffa]|uniref:Reverse transcriptase zinc-binding domain-containing protein n=1 Tax=Hibiscus sabdariffa TaxID=183260 RepID=A0ABR2DFB8_9ROSI
MWGNGLKVDFWRDVWLGDFGPFVHSITGLTLVLSDQFTSKWSENRHFSVRSAYALGDVQTQNVTDNVWIAISKFKGTPRIKTFLWLLARGTILTNLERVRRYIVVDNRCGVCGDIAESIDTLFRWCSIAATVWISLVKPYKFDEFIHMDRLVWLQVNLTRPYYFARDPDHWDMLFGAVIWKLWLNRKQLIFESCNTDSRPIIDLSRLLRDDMARVAASATTIHSHVLVDTHGAQ